ncbi:histidinol dehydrogenase [bacterium MnTg02]|nr:histidinol dehydrogenase [bacterium MnTg02]
MVRQLDSALPEFGEAFEELLASKRAEEFDVDAVVREIIAEVRVRGDQALIDYSKRFDKVDLDSVGIRVARDEIVRALDEIDPETMAALELAHDRLIAHHERQIPKDDRYTDAEGVELGTIWKPVESAGLYVPGGTASYPSSVLMNAVPAKVAGVDRVAMTVPAPKGVLNPLVLGAAHISGVDEIYRVGGAQAVAALAYGTETIAPVDKIVGPGNAYVAAAKKMVFGDVGIDMIAGPSEVLIVADGDNDADWIAADLLAQAEHDASAQSILMSDDADFAKAVAEAVDRQLATLPRGNIAAASWEKHGAIICLTDLNEAPPLVDRIAPEHLEIATADPEDLMGRIRNAGAIFLGRYTPEVIGDYVAGSNHVLPTARSARFSSGLGVLDFMKRSSLLRLDKAALEKLGSAAMRLAKAEGLEAHSRSVGVRFGERPW